jgi:two-component system cell cycle response regulator CpdR
MGQMEKKPEPQDRQKTVLIVDDDGAVLNLVAEILADGNYKVLTASSGSAALQQSTDCKGEIHLLLSDFQMTGMNGVDLATQITRDRPRLKTLLMSGFNRWNARPQRRLAFSGKAFHLLATANVGFWTRLPEQP